MIDWVACWAWLSAVWVVVSVLAGMLIGRAIRVGQSEGSLGPLARRGC